MSTINKLTEYLKQFGEPDESIAENVYDYAGGNFDDAFQLGVTYGQNDVAQAVKEILEDKA